MSTVIDEKAGSTPAPATREDRIYGPEPKPAPAVAPEPEKVKPAESEPAKPTPEPGKTPDKTASESEPETKVPESKGESLEERQKRDRENNDRRLHRKITERDRTIGQLSAEVERLRKQTAEAGKTPDKTPESAPGTALPQLETFEGTYEEFIKARDAKLAENLRKQWEAEQRDSQTRQQSESLDAQWNQKVGKYVGKDETRAEQFAENWQHVVSQLASSPQAAIYLKDTLLDSDVGPHLIDHLSSNDADLAELAKAQTARQAARIVDRIETALLAAEKKTTTPNPTNAPKTPSTVSGTGSAVPKLSREDKFYPKQKD